MSEKQYVASGSLTTDSREVSTSETWSTQEDWDGFQSKDNIDIIEGSLTLSEFEVTDGGANHQYLMDEGSGGTLNDGIQDPEDLPVSLEGAGWSDAFGGYEWVVTFDGNDDYATWDDTLDWLVSDDDWGLAIWIRCDDVTSRNTIAGNVRDYDTSDDDARWYLEVKDGGDIEFWDYGSSSGDYLITDVITESEWYFVAVRCDENGSAEILVNDKSEISLSYSSIGHDIATEFKLGQIANSSSTGDGTLEPGREFEGQMDLCYLWRSEPTDEQLTEVYDDTQGLYNNGGYETEQIDLDGNTLNSYSF